MGGGPRVPPVGPAAAARPGPRAGAAADDERGCPLQRNCWGFAYSVLEAAAAPSDSVTVSAGAHGDAWAALVAVTDRVQSTLTSGHDLLGEQRNAALAPGDVLMLWHQNTGEEERATSAPAAPEHGSESRSSTTSRSSRRRRPLPGKGGLGRRDALPPHRLGWVGGVVAARRLRVGLAAQKAGHRRAAGARGLRLQVGTEGRARGGAIRLALRGHGEALVGQDPRRAPDETTAGARRCRRPRSRRPRSRSSTARTRANRPDQREKRNEAKRTPLSVDGPAPLGRVPAAACVFAGGLYIFGGETDDMRPWVPIPNRYLNDVWRLDLRSGRWEERGRRIRALRAHAIRRRRDCDVWRRRRLCGNQPVS